MLSGEAYEEQQLKQSHSGVLLGGALKHIPRTILYFEGTEVSRLLSCFLGIVSQALRILSQIHFWTVF